MPILIVAFILLVIGLTLGVYAAGIALAVALGLLLLIASLN